MAAGVMIDAVLAAVPASGPMACGRVVFRGVFVVRAPRGVLAGVAADAQNAVRRDGAEEADQSGILRGEKIRMAQLRGLVAEPDEVRRHGCELVVRVDRQRQLI